MSRYQQSPRSRAISEHAHEQGWSYAPQAGLDLADYRVFSAFPALEGEVEVRNLVDGNLDGMAFRYVEYDPSGGHAAKPASRAALLFATPFGSPGLFTSLQNGAIPPTVHLRPFPTRTGIKAYDATHRTWCAEPGFAPAVLESGVTDILIEHPHLTIEWHGNDLAIVMPGRPDDWQDHLAVCEVIARLLMLEPEMGFQEARVSPPLPSAKGKGYAPRAVSWVG